MLDQNVTILNANAEDIYEILTKSSKHAELTDDTADINAVVGGGFTTFGGYATGETLELVPGKLVKQTWRASDWPEGHFSTITFDLSDTDTGANIHFTQENLPEGTIEEFKSGWEDFYWSPLKNHFS